MKGYIKIGTEEAGKQIAIVASVDSVIDVCNIELVNTDPITFTYNPETGEFTILSRAVISVTGHLVLVTGTDENADLTILLQVNGNVAYQLYTGINNQRDFIEFDLGVEAGDVLTFTVTSPDNVTVETTDTMHFIIIERKY